MSMPQARWYAVIDGARDPRLAQLVQSCRQHLCLMKGDLHPDVLDVAPWLVRIDDGDPLIPTWQQHGQGQSWGIMLCSTREIEGLREHLRTFLQAMLPDGMMALFRFYDPRVFNTYIRAATPDERTPWFDGVVQFNAEADGGQGMHQYRLDQGRLFDGNNSIG
jgi:hypothetical protein